MSKTSPRNRQQKVPAFPTHFVNETPPPEMPQDAFSR